MTENCFCMFCFFYMFFFLTVSSCYFNFLWLSLSFRCVISCVKVLLAKASEIYASKLFFDSFAGRRAGCYRGLVFRVSLLLERQQQQRPNVFTDPCVSTCEPSLKAKWRCLGTMKWKLEQKQWMWLSYESFPFFKLESNLLLFLLRLSGKQQLSTISRLQIGSRLNKFSCLRRTEQHCTNQTNRSSSSNCCCFTTVHHHEVMHLSKKSHFLHTCACEIKQHLNQTAKSKGDTAGRKYNVGSSAVDSEIKGT